MRTLCLLLILANVLFMAWSQLIDVRVSSLDRKSAKVAAPPARIVLARELTQDNPAQRNIDQIRADQIREVQPPAVEPLGQSRSASSPNIAQLDALSCTSVGPFADLPQAAQAQAALQSAGLQPRQRMEQGELWIGYWVSVQGLATRDAAESVLKRLSANGISDVYLMPGSDPPNVLSLGVFSDYQRAQRRVDEVRALGLTPRIDDRKRAGSVFWIDVDLQEPGQLVDTSIFQSDPRKITRLEMRPCPASGGGSAG